jgi:hypothetical protein
MSMVTCQDCGIEFTARSDAKRCPSCKQEEAKKHGSRPRPERYNEPGVGKGNYNRIHTVICKLCFTPFQTKAWTARYCEDCRIVVRRAIEKKSDKKTKYIQCPYCPNQMHYKSKMCVDCRAKMMVQATGENNPSWKGGKTTHKQGYIMVKETRPDKKGKYQLEHTAVWEAANGPLPDGYVIHHLNGQKTDNRLENLQALPRHQHHKEPREALIPYEEKIAALEKQIAELKAK